MKNSLDSLRVPKKDRSKQKGSSTRTVISIAGIILSAVIGLAGGCFMLYLVYPEHPLIESLASIFCPSNNAAREEPSADSRPCKSIEPENRRLAAPPSQPDAPPKANKPQPAQDPFRIDDAPKAAETPLTPIPPTPSPPDTLPKANEPQPAQDAGRSDDAPKIAAETPPTDIHKEIVLDLSRSASFVALPEIVKDDKAKVQVQSVANLCTPYELKPSHGVLSAKQPVDIVLTEHIGICIRLSLIGRDCTRLKIAPAMDLGQGKKIEFTQQRIQQAYVTLNRDANKLNRQLSEARNEAKNIEIWLASPVTKPMQLRAMKKQQLLVLKEKMIPALEREVQYTQTRGDMLQQISQLIEQIHGTASIHLVIRTAAGDGSL